MKRAAAAVLLALLVLTGTADPATAEPDTPPATVAERQTIIPDSGAGQFPTSNYDIGYDGGAWNNIQRKFFGLLTELAFGVVRWLLGIALWLVRWAYGFGVADALGDPALRIGRLYEAEFIGPVGLRQAAIFAALAWAGYHGLRGRLQMAAGELLVSLIVAALGGIILANPQGYLTGMFDTTTRLSGVFLALGTGAEPPDTPQASTAVLDPLAGHLHAAFIEQPYDLLNWGEPLTGACAAARDRIVATGPHGSEDEPREVMRAAGCGAQADFNHDPTAERLGGALLTLVATAAVVLLLALISITLLVAQIITVLLFAVAPFALVFGLVPGGGREVMWRWAGGLARVFLAIVGMSFVLSLLLLVVDGLLAASEGASIMERFSLLVLVTIGMFIVRKRVVASGAHLAERLGQRLAGARGTARGGGWMAPAAAGGISGFALGSALRESAGDLPGSMGYRLRYMGQHPYYRQSWRMRRRVHQRHAPSGSRPPGSALGRLGQRAAKTAPARLATAVAHGTATTASLAYKSTIGLPVHGPRAYRAAASAVSLRQAHVKQSLHAYKAEYVSNLTKLRRRGGKG